MTGKTHYKLGIMYYIIFSILPLMSAVPLLQGNSRITLASVGAAALGALIVDSDTERSLISQVNPVAYGTNKVVSTVEMLFNRILRLVIGTVAGYLILSNLSKITQIFGSGDKTYYIAYFTAFTCIFAGVTSERFIQRLPVISILYNVCSSAISIILTVVKSFLVFICYIAAAAGIVIYNVRHGNQVVPYIIAAIILGTVLLPHRTFLHSIEGFILYSVIAKYIFGMIHFPQLADAFITGYFSHVYLADILTNNGVPVSVLPTVLKKTGMHDRLARFSVYRAINRVLNTKLSFSVMSTGTSSGNIFEHIYCSILFILAAILILNKYNLLNFSLV